jgi:hypothetical protein
VAQPAGIEVASLGGEGDRRRVDQQFSYRSDSALDAPARPARARSVNAVPCPTAT